MQQNFRESIPFASELLPSSWHICDPIEGDWRFFLHIHEQLEILLFRKGAVEVTCGDAQFTANAGDVVVIDYDTPHCFRTTAANCVYDCLFVQTSFLEKFGFAVKQTHFQPLIRDAEVTQLYTRLRDITAEFYRKNSEEPSQSRLLLARALALALTAVLVDRFSQPCSEHKALNNRTELIKAVSIYVQDHLCEPISLDDISREVNFSKAYLCRVFREYTGNTLFDLIQQRRCEHARELLLQGKHTISECAQLSGFSTPSYFSKIYRRCIGELPSESIKKAAPAHL